MPLSPAIVAIVAGNLIPLLGIAFWGWDAFILLLLYWLETVTVAFWTLLRLLLMPSVDPDGVIRREFELRPANIVMAGFFTLHAGGFIAGHLLFLWVLFSSDWWERISGPVSFFNEIVIGEGLWLPLVIMFAAGGWTMFFGAYEQRARPGRRAPSEKDGGVLGGIVMALYIRIVILHVAIIFGAWGVDTIGNLAPLALVILFKTYAEIYLGSSEPVRARMRAAVGR